MPMDGVSEGGIQQCPRKGRLERCGSLRTDGWLLLRARVASSPSRRHGIVAEMLHLLTPATDLTLIAEGHETRL
jgi:hypothetical protein